MIAFFSYILFISKFIIFEMAITTKNTFSNKKYKQDALDTINLKGTTIIDNGGKLRIDDGNSKAGRVLTVDANNNVIIVETGGVNGIASLDNSGMLQQNVDAGKITTGTISKDRLPSDIGVQSDWNETNVQSNAYIKNKPSIDVNYKIYIVKNITELQNACDNLVGFSGEILIANDISLTSNITLNLQNVTINGNGNKLNFNGYNITTPSTNVTFTNLTFRGTKGNVAGSDLLMTFANGGVFLFEYCTFYNICYNTTTPTENFRFSGSTSLRVFNCQYTNEFGYANNKLILYINNASYLLLSLSDFFQRSPAQIGVIGFVPGVNVLMIDNSVKMLEDGHYINWSDKVYLGGTVLSRMNYWNGTQVQYDAIPTKDNNTIYFINE